MEDKCKRAYRRLLYYAMLDIRSHRGISPYRTFPWWKMKALISAVRMMRQKTLLAEWLHNLAQFCADEALDDFSEPRFWNEYESFKKCSPRIWSYDYRERFLADLE